MLAAQLVAPGRFELGEFARPSPEDGQVVVRMVASSICGSDLHVVYGPFQPERWPGDPGAPGHEGVGFVEESRSPLFRPGDAVLTVPHLGRMTCFAEYHLAEEWALVRLGAGVELTSVVMAQQLGTVLFAMKRFWRGRPARCVTVIGAGSAGLFFVQLLKARGVQTVVVADPVAARRKTAVALGADHVVDPGTDPVADVSHDLSDGQGADLVIEAAGTTRARLHAVASARDQGTVGFFGYAEQAGVELFPYAEAWRKSLDMVTSANTQLEPGLPSFKEAVRMISAGEISVGHLTADPPLPLDRVQDGFEAAREHRLGKVVFETGRS